MSYISDLLSGWETSEAEMSGGIRPGGGGYVLHSFE